MSDHSTPGAGWYPDPADPKTNRYWDGEKWTESRAPSSTVKAEKAEGADIAGYVLAVLFPIVGFIIGLVRLNRSRHGIWIIVTSIVAFFIWIAIFASSGDTGYTY